MEWFLITGVLLVVVAVAASAVERLPLSLPVLYLGVGVLLGPWALGLLEPDPVADAALLERLTEVAVVVSLFGAGLKMRIPLTWRAWRVPVRLATLSMAVTVGLIALAAWALLGIDPGAAIVLGAVLAPTDPVLAAEVQLRHAFDDDELRRNLTGEAGLNDGTAFPFVLLGLGVLGAGSLGPGGSAWVAVDVLWASAAGLLIGALVAVGVARLVLYARRSRRSAVGLDDFLALGIVALAYGAAVSVHAYGFLAAFAAGVAVRWIERQEIGEDPPDEARDPGPEAETHPEHAPAYMAQTLLNRNEELERIGELALVVVVGAMLATVEADLAVAALVALLFVVLRPVAVRLGLAGVESPRGERRLVAWFGVRGIGSLYYLSYAVTHGLPEGDARVVASVALVTVAASVVAHGVSVTPLLRQREDREMPAGRVA